MTATIAACSVAVLVPTAARADFVLGEPPVKQPGTPGVVQLQP